ncbi:OmpA family protein [Odoribacter lunatus]|uniref:OmpA family protein n=1 Tax=Odoribacter lunatus TaxID=2941335 RepID=UPI00204200C4|nr:OmpA family protein [Odoribacter lunatus]
MKKFIRLFFILLCVWLCAACSARYYMKRGNALRETGRFYKASTKYEKAYNKSKLPEAQVTAAMSVAQCYEDVNKQPDAYNWYRKALRANKEYPEVHLKLAEVAIIRGELEAAEEHYTQFDELFPDDERGKNGLYNIGVLKAGIEKAGRYSVQIAKEFNSRYNDFSPVYYPEDNNIVYFTSARKTSNKKRGKVDPVTGDAYNHIYVTEFTNEIRTKDKRGNLKIRRFPEPRWVTPALVRDSIFSGKDDGSLCFSSDGTTLFFTSSREIKGSNVGTRIYKSTANEDKDGKKGWTTLLGAGICNDSVSLGHPAVTQDGSRLYFSTDQLSGGMGGKDIWYVELVDGIWSEPQNAGEVINTPGNEMFPVIRDNGDLYFASDGHDGFGGLDIYVLKTTEEGEHIEHLPYPINSFADDFGITFKNGKEEGLFSSSRSNRSDNIYSFAFIPQQLQVRLLVKNSVTELPVPQVNVTVTADDGEVSYVETDSLGILEMPVAPQREYIFLAEHPRYLKGKELLSTYKEKGDRTYELNIEMQPIEKPIVIPNIYFDVAKWDLRQDAMDNLKELLTILKDNPNITIELSAHTDMIGNDQANLILSDRRANSVVNYLIEKGVYWDRLVAKGYGETQPRQINEKDAQAYPFLKVGDVLSENFVRRLKGSEKEDAMQLNRRIEFKVLRTDYKPGPNSLHNPNQVAQTAEETEKIGEVSLKDLNSIKGKFYTLQLGIFRTVPAVINNFRVVFTEKTAEGAVRYCAGIYESREEAARAANELKQKGIECFVKECNH